ncbi:MAG TPA: Glu-tRNA(Gln) amidotransferase subunit GatE [Candidatus Altiarchaeales archaeon]|nr:Glu-tRNA(Gln) amidotransferase subunit GatE [Candidatus Altiarchaeales archaeon]
MTNLDYKSLGFKCGIEIHQQLDTHKLFCSCPSEIREDEPDIIVKRKMRAVAGEIGDVDPAALHEFLRGREFVYQAYSDTNCLVELDEEPPHPLNEEALDIALEISLLLNARPVDELQVMRKTVIDGSNTSGFQRTVLIAMDGYLDTEMGRIGIPTICLEEDAARKIEEKKDVTVYRLDRLGIPLIEICTTPDIKSPEHAREVAEKIGMILRATGKVKRGLGTIRQDLNVSIEGGGRIEIKGVQDLRLIKNVLRREVERQLMLINIKKELLRRGIRKDDLKSEFFDVTSVFENTRSGIIAKILENGGRAISVRLKGFNGLLKGMLGPELAQYVRAITGVKGIFHSDELPAYGISENETKDIRKKLNLETNDAFALVVEKRDLAERALKEVLERCKISLKGVPEETRRAREDGTTEFMRPLPGSARMYPETDEPLLVITKDRLMRIKKKLPELPEERLRHYLDLGLGRELSNQLIKSKFCESFDEFNKKFPRIKPSVIATTLLSMPKEVKKRYNVDIEKLKKSHYEAVLMKINEGKISKGAIPEILAEFARNPGRSIEDIIEEKDLELLSENEIEKVIDRIMGKNPERTLGALMGMTMAELKGRADAGVVRRILSKKLRE